MAKPAATVRPATEDDAEAVLALLRSTPHLEVAFDAAEFWVASVEGAVRGCARLKRHADGSLEIASVIVAPELRGAGIATRLAEAALTSARGPVYALALAPGFFVTVGFHPLDVAALPPPILAKANGMCASTGAVAMVRA